MFYRLIREHWCSEQDPSGCRQGVTPWWMQFHAMAAFGVFMLAGALAALDYHYSPEAYKGYLSGFVTEFGGVAVTILLVDMALERRAKVADVRRMADELLFQVDYLVWLWLGGDRVFSYNEMLALLSRVEKHDKLHPTLETQMQNLGNEAGKFKRINAETVHHHKDLIAAVETIAKFASIRVKQEEFPPLVLKDIISSAAQSLACVLGYEKYKKPNADLEQFTTTKQSSIYHQYFRLTGEYDSKLEKDERKEEVIQFDE
ncbi:hypothetical protein [Halodesulfovibrio aestuarii]|uniref:Uncharacterized protein n=1 Tax=Halodesulfovibrio aestuarii TaxID=126333 RepID=A0ABV4JQX1_9BACT